MERESEESTLSSDQLHHLAETHLRMRNFTLARQYLIELQSSLHNSTSSNRRSLNRIATQLLAVADVLASATNQPPLNHYSILQLDSFTPDHNLIRTHFKKLLLILGPIKPTSPLAQEALNYVHSSYNILLDPSKKAKFDVELRNVLVYNGGGAGAFWTFCPHCFYLYEYETAYLGCCLRCQNCRCRRAFQGVALPSLPRMELGKGCYFGCYGFFPMGFSPDQDGEKEMGKFGSWSPIVGMFPVKRVKSTAGRIDLNGDSNGVYYDRTNFVEILDESDESEAEAPEAKGENFMDNVSTDMHIVDKPRTMRRKSVAVNARELMRGGRNEGLGDANDSSDNSVSDSEDFGLEDNRNLGDEGQVDDDDEGDVAFYEEDGEIFVDLGAGGGL